MVVLSYDLSADTSTSEPRSVSLLPLSTQASIVGEVDAKESERRLTMAR